MSKPILVGFDPEHADPAPVLFGATVAQFTGAPLIVATVGDADAEPPAQVADVAAHWRRLQGSSVARALHEAAEESDALLVVIGLSHRSRVGSAVAGSTGLGLLHGAPCPVAVVPPTWKPKERLKSVGVAYADTPESREALRAAHAIARSTGATLKIFSIFGMHGSTHLEAQAHQSSWEHEVRDMTDVEGGHLVQLEQHLRDVAADLAPDVDAETEAMTGHAADEIQRLSGLVDLMVVGSRGYGPRRAVLLGSVSRGLLEHTQSPAIVIPRGVEDAFERGGELPASAT